MGIGALVWWVEMSVRAKEDECEENEEIKETDKHILSQSKVKDVDLAIEFVDTHNDHQQQGLNKIKTNTAIKKIERKITSKKIKDKSHKRLTKKLNELKEKGLIDKTYKPIKFSDIISYDDSDEEYEMIGIRRIKYNPILDGLTFKTILTFLRFCSMGGVVGLSFSLGIPLSTLLVTMGIYISMLFSTTLRRYNKVRIKTATKYLFTRREKLKLIVDMNDYINNKIKKESDVNE